MLMMQSILRKSTWLLWLVLGAAFDWIEATVFHTDTWIGLTIGILVGTYLGYILNRPKTRTEPHPQFA
jgi:hypothetical protein